MNDPGMADEHARDGVQGEPSDEVVADALGLAGAWSDLDWEQTAEELDRIRHTNPPTPPIDLVLCGGSCSESPC